MSYTTHGYHMPGTPTNDEDHNWDSSRKLVTCGGIPFCRQCTYEAGVAVNELANICPECRSGKCRNCDGVALNRETDEFVPCECPIVSEGDHPLR